jgi:NAD(P)-dependent dehydrogenase (short-subunit alcohol dehydrogenase family)
MDEDTATEASPEVRALRVIITGAASGIGRATAQLLAERGAAVAAIDRDEVAGSALEREARAAGLAIAFVRADVASEAETTTAIVEAIEWLGGVDGLVASAGVMRGQLLPIEDLDLGTWQQVIDVNLRGAFIAAKVVAPRMREAGHGVIVLVGSKAGMIVGSGSYAYGASKGGIHGLALALDRHLGPLGIRVHEVCPGDVDTPLLRGSVAEGLEHGGDPAAAARLLGKLTTPHDVAEVLAFLVSDAGAAVRGTVYTA